MHKRNLLRHEVTNLPITAPPTYSNSPATTRTREDKPPTCSPRSCQKAEASGCTRNCGSRSTKEDAGSARL